jgi:hypothetical protein
VSPSKHLRPKLMCPPSAARCHGTHRRRLRRITRPFESSTASARFANDHAADRTRTAEAGVIGGRFLRTRTRDPAAVVISPQWAQGDASRTGSGHPRGSFSRQYLAWGRAQGRPKGSRVEFGRRCESDRRVTGCRGRVRRFSVSSARAVMAPITVEARRARGRPGTPGTHDAGMP